MRGMRLMAPLMLGLSVATIPALRAQAQMSIGLVITLAPPVLPIYDQPPIPEPGYHLGAGLLGLGR